MPLDKDTLVAQLKLLSENAASLDKTIVEQSNALRVLTFDLEASKGARRYHDIIVQQTQRLLAEIDAPKPAA